MANESKIQAHGLKLLTLASPKTIKGEKRGFISAILYLAPAETSGRNVCPMSTAGCRAVCLNTSGRGAFPKVQLARIRKTNRFFSDRDGFMSQIAADLDKVQTRAHAIGLRVACRLNGTSDILWQRIRVTYGGREHENIHALFPAVQFYEYTKHKPDKFKGAPANLALTFSRSEENERDALRLLRAGERVAVVWRKELPAMWKGFTVIDADGDDLRFLDGGGQVMGLKAKGKARRDVSGFVLGLE